MKIRTDFVTNSSSSSFILGFTSKENIGRELGDHFPTTYPEALGRVYKDVLEADPLTPEDIINRVSDSLEWEKEYELINRYKLYQNMSYKNAWDYVNSENGKSEVEKLVEKELDDVRNALLGNSYFVEVEYEDHEYPDLEHDVMPYVQPLIYRISHH